MQGRDNVESVQERRGKTDPGGCAELLFHEFKVGEFSVSLLVLRISRLEALVPARC